MNRSNILIVVILLLCAVSVVLEFNQREILSRVFKSCIVPTITVFYFISVTKKSKYFVWFLLLFSFSDVLSFIEVHLESDLSFDLYYTFGNLLYIAGYLFLLLEVFKSISIKDVLKNYMVHLVVLTILNAYIVYVLMVIVNPYLSGSYLYYIEALYNIIILILLSVSLVNYLHNESKKSLLLFIGSLFIVFSEVIQIAYYYISERTLLQVASTFLFVIAFLFFYYQSKIENKPIKIYLS
ncbi:hypothetical protein GCM10022271_25120 [Corallibacter vietnamensis]|uniref:YhhN-like protein n=1 Tax=Corallibacter vietnamensis TaxID=904130 RepID=A0ABP7HDF7_9FLAO